MQGCEGCMDPKVQGCERCEDVGSVKGVWGVRAQGCKGCE